MSEGYTRFTNNLLEAAYRNEGGLTHRELRVYLCIIRYTLGWKRKTASLSNSFISNACDLDRSHVHKALKALESKGWITMSSNGCKTRDITVSTHKQLNQVLSSESVADITTGECSQMSHKTVAESAPKIERNKRGDETDTFFPPEVQLDSPIPDDSFREFTHEEEMDLFIADPEAFAQMKKEKPSPCAEEEGQNVLPKWMI